MSTRTFSEGMTEIPPSVSFACIVEAKTNAAGERREKEKKSAVSRYGIKRKGYKSAGISRDCEFVDREVIQLEPSLGWERQRRSVSGSERNRALSLMEGTMLMERRRVERPSRSVPLQMSKRRTSLLLTLSTVLLSVVLCSLLQATQAFTPLTTSRPWHYTPGKHSSASSRRWRRRQNEPSTLAACPEMMDWVQTSVATAQHTGEVSIHHAVAAITSTLIDAAANVDFPNIPQVLELPPDSPDAIPVFIDPIQHTMEEEIGMAAVNSLGRDFLTFLAATVAVVPLSSYFNITPVLGFLAAGCLLGPYGLGVFATTEANVQLGDIGILFLLFSEGLNLSPDRIKALGAFGGLGVLQLLASMTLLFGGILASGPLFLQYVAPILHADVTIDQIFQSPTIAFCIAAAGALSSSAFVLPVLKEKGWEDRPEGIAALSVLLLQDLAVAPMLVIVPIIAGAGPQTGSELGLLAAKATVGFGAALVLGSYLIRYVFDAVAAARSTETFVAAALLVALGMGEVADFLGLSATTGAFAAGVLLANNRYRAQIKADVRPFEGILLGIFFLTSGASLDPQVVFSELPTLLVGIFVFIVIKAIVLFLAGPVLGKTRAQAARVAITLSGGGEFSLVLFNLARDVGVLPDDLSKVLSASVIISMSLTPLLAVLADNAGEYLETLDANDSSLSLTKEEALKMFENIDTDKSGTIDLDELRTALIGRQLSYISISEIFLKVDTNGDGIISREEWLSAMDKGFLASALAAGPPDSEEWQKERERRAQESIIADDAIVICGYTEFGRELYDLLDAAGMSQEGGLVTFDLNPSRVAAGWLAGVNAVYGDGASPDLLRGTGVTRPRAVVVAYRSEARRLEATARLREGLPEGTPIYSRVVSGQSLGKNELIEAGATEVVSERTEAALRFGTLLNAFQGDDKVEELRRRFTGKKPSVLADYYGEDIPGLSEERLNDMAEGFDCTKRDLIRLHEVFTSLPDGGQFVGVEELRDVFLRTAGEGPVDDETLERWVELADFDRSGVLSFTDFARVYFSSGNATAKRDA